MAAFTTAALFGIGVTAAGSAATATAAATLSAGALLAVDAALIGTAAAIGGQMYSGQQQAAQGRQMAAQESLNANIGRQNAQAIQQSGQFDIDRQKRQQAQLIGRQRALTAKSGVRFSGSPLDVMSDTIAETELDMAVTRYNTDIASRRALSGAGYSDYLAGSYKTQGQVAQSESLWKAGSTLLTSGANISNKYGGAFKYKSNLSKSEVE